MDRDRIERSKKALLEWHQKLLPEAYSKDHYFYLFAVPDLSRLCDDLLDAAMSIEEQGRIADAAMKALSVPKAA